MSEQEKKPIDNVTVTSLDVALRMCGIEIDLDTLDVLIDVIELLEEKGEEVTIKDMLNLVENHSKKL